MTENEKNEYNKLPNKQRKVYDFYKDLHPNWSHSQIMTKVAMGKIEDDVVNKGGGNLNPGDPIVLRDILKGAKKFLIGIGVVGYAIFNAIDTALEALGDIIAQGITYIGNKLSDFWDWLTD